MNCYLSPDSKAQSDPRETETSGATEALQDLTPAHQANTFSASLTPPTTSPVRRWHKGHQWHSTTPQWGTALAGWLSNTEKAEHTTEAWLLAFI